MRKHKIVNLLNFWRNRHLEHYNLLLCPTHTRTFDVARIIILPDFIRRDSCHWPRLIGRVNEYFLLVTTPQIVYGKFRVVRK